jgi:mitogen-activated protein kinase kinase
MQFTHPRPIGPRSNPRSMSPASFSLSGIPPNPSLRLTTTLQAPTPSVVRSPTPSLSLQIPGFPKQRPTTPKVPPLAIPTANGSSTVRSDTDSPVSNAAFAGGYYGGPTNAPLELDPLSAEDGGVTITPFTRVVTPNPAEPIADLRQTLEGLNRPPDPSINNRPSDEDIPSLDSSQWSDERVDVIDRLGEGAGGAVHKVRDRQTSDIMARKTITTREAPMKQLLRELNIIASATHDNIIVFYGAYISPSSSEVKILMEFCEGGSLEAVGKRIRERGGRVGEKVAGRLAEGVSQIHTPGPDGNSDYAMSRFCKDSLTSTLKGQSTAILSHQTFYSREMAL